MALSTYLLTGTNRVWCRAKKRLHSCVPQVDFCALTVTLELSHLSKGSNQVRSSDELQWCESEYIQAQCRTSGMMRGMRDIELMCESLEEDRPEEQREPNSVTRRRCQCHCKYVSRYRPLQSIRHLIPVTHCWLTAGMHCSAGPH